MEADEPVSEAALEATAASPLAPDDPDAGETPSIAERRRRVPVLAVVAVAIVLVIAGVGVLYLEGVGPFARTPSSTAVASSGQTYAEATAIANNSASAYESGSWTPILAAAADTPSALLESTALPGDLFGTSCRGTPTSSTTTATFEGFSGALSSGESPDWLMILLGASATILVVTVIGG